MHILAGSTKEWKAQNRDATGHVPRSPLLPALPAGVYRLPQQRHPSTSPRGVRKPTPHLSPLQPPESAQVPVFCLCSPELELIELSRVSWSFNEEGKGEWLPDTLGLLFLFI